MSSLSILFAISLHCRHRVLLLSPSSGFFCNFPWCFLFAAASFASLSASSFPLTPACALSHHSFIFQFADVISISCFLISSIRNVCVLLFFSASSVIRLSACIVTVFSFVCMFSVCLSAVSIANCSVWLLMQLSFNLHCMLLMWRSDFKNTVPERTPFSLLLPSVNICIRLLSSVSSNILLIASAECCQCLTSISLSTSKFLFALPYVISKVFPFLLFWWRWTSVLLIHTALHLMSSGVTLLFECLLFFGLL